MSTTGAVRVATEGGDSYKQRVTPLELFFDLVFVFALGVKQTLAHVGDPFGMIPTVALCGSVAL